MQKLALLIVILCINYTCFSQVKFNNTQPYSFVNEPETYKNKVSEKAKQLYKYSKKVKKLKELPKKTVKGLDFQKLKTELDKKHVEDSTYAPIGQAIVVNIDILKDGTWEDISDSIRFCRTKVYTENSSAQLLFFDKFYLPEGTQLLIFDTQGTLVLGPLTSENNKPSKKFMTGIIQGPELIFEYYENKKNKYKPELLLSKIGVIFSYDYGDGTITNLKDRNNQSQNAKIPVAVDLDSIQQNGYNIFDDAGTAPCEYITNFSNLDDDQIWRIQSASCQLITMETTGGLYSSPAVLLRGKDYCEPRIATAGHVAWPYHDFENYSVIRFGWNRMCDQNQGLQSIDFTKVIDYYGTRILRHFPHGIDMSIFELIQKLVHKVWMAGWDTRDTLGVGKDEFINYGCAALNRIFFAPVGITKGHLTYVNGNSYLLGGDWKVGNSGTPVFFQHNNNEYLYVGPLCTSFGEVSKFPKAYVYNGIGDELHRGLQPLFSDDCTAPAGIKQKVSKLIVKNKRIFF